MHEKQRKLAAIENRLANHENTTRIGLLWLSASGSAALLLLGLVIARL